MRSRNTRFLGALKLLLSLSLALPPVEAAAMVRSSPHETFSTLVCPYEAQALAALSGWFSRFALDHQAKLLTIQTVMTYAAMILSGGLLASFHIEESRPKPKWPESMKELPPVLQI